MKLRKGMSVTCKIDGTAIKDAKIQEENGLFYICQNEIDGENCEDKLGYKYSWLIFKGSDNDIEWFGVTDLKPLKSLENLCEGDIITDGHGERMVLGVYGKVYFMSKKNNFDYADENFTAKELEDYEYELKESDPDSEFIEINGKRYKKEDVEDRVKELKEL